MCTATAEETQGSGDFLRSYGLTPARRGLARALQVGGLNKKLIKRFGDPKKEAKAPQYLRNAFLDTAAGAGAGRGSLRINLGGLPSTGDTAVNPVVAPGATPGVAPAAPVEAAPQVEPDVAPRRFTSARLRITP